MHLFRQKTSKKHTISERKRKIKLSTVFFLSIMLTLWDKWSQSYRVLRENMAVSQDATKIYCQAQEK